MKKFLLMASDSQLITASWWSRIAYMVGILTASHAVHAQGTTQAVAIPSWTSVAPLSQARSQHAAVSVADNIYVWGGYTGGAAGNSSTTVDLNSLEIYSATTNTWRAGAVIPIKVRGQASAAGVDGSVYSFGGAESTSPVPTNEAYRYIPATNTWTTIAPMFFRQWEAEAETGNDGRIYVFGGFGVGMSAATQIYTPATDTWTIGASMPTGRYGEVVIKDGNGLMHVIGGHNFVRPGDPLTALTTHEVYNPTTDTWATAAPLPTGLNQAGGTLGPDGNLYVIGGTASYINNTGPFYNTVYIYSPSTNTWSQDTSLPMTLGETQAVTVSGSIYTIAGTNGTQQRVVYRSTLLCSSPVLTLPANQTVAATTGQCSASVAFAATATNQAAVTYAIGTTPITSPYTFPVGTTTVTIRAVNSCGSATGSFTVTVQDRQAPTIFAAGFITALESNGTRTIEAADVDYGSFDNCGGSVSLSISPRTFTCANIGPNQVTLTVRDNAGNTASQTVTVVIVDNTAPVVVAAGFQTALINGTRTIEAADVDGGSYDDCGSIASLSISPRTFTCANVGPNQVTLTVRDNAGNVATQTVTVLITADGTCSPAARPSNTGSLALAGEVGKMQVYPNPATTEATLTFEAQQAGRAQVLVYNSLGRLVATLYDGVAQAGQRYERTLNGTNLPAGLYTCRFIGQGKSVTQRLVLTK